jgi:GDSL-like Lipase/Acylhydrolase family
LGSRLPVLRRNASNVIAFRFDLSGLGSWSDWAQLEQIQLRIPLAAPIPRARSIELGVAWAAADFAPADLRRAGALWRQPRLTTIRIPVSLPAGEREIVVPTSRLLPGWREYAAAKLVAGQPPASAALLVNRTDPDDGGLVLDGTSARNAQALRLCSGGCPIADENRDGRIVLSCIGDSNTASAGVTFQTQWCDRLVELGAAVGLEVRNHAIAAQTASAHGVQQMERALADQDADIIVIAFVTNDRGRPVEDVRAAFREMQAMADQQGVRTLVALGPPLRCYEFEGYSEDPMIALNGEISALFPPSRILDFYSLMNTAADYYDCLHMNQSGQDKRASLVWERLRPVSP